MVPTPYGVFSTISASSPPKGQAAVSIMAEKSGNPDYYRVSAQLATGLTDTIEFGIRNTNSFKRGFHRQLRFLQD